MLDGKPLIRKVGPRNRPQTYVSIKLALCVLSEYDKVFSWHVFTHYEKSLKAEKSTVLLELQNLYKRVELLEAENAKLKNKAIDVDLVGGKYLLYAYTCNNKVKFGTSFCNKNGQRPKSHKTSVPDLSIGFVIYAPKKCLQEVNRLVKRQEKFPISARFEHIKCTIEEFEEFVIKHLDNMGYAYKKEDIHKLNLLNSFLES